MWVDRNRVYEAFFRVSLKHASLWAEIFKKLRLKGLQMEMIVGERGLVVGGQRSCTKHACFVVGCIQEIEVEGAADGDDPGEKGGRCGWTEASETCFVVG